MQQHSWIVSDMTRYLINVLYIICVTCVPTYCYVARYIGQNPYKQRGSVKICSADEAGDFCTSLSRRDILRVIPFGFVFSSLPPVTAATRESLEELLYRIVRVREATEMETRLIKTGKFKDAQRANIKLAVRFMLDNYRLNDAFLAASTYLDGTNRRLEATQLGQSATQNLVTILEYFDASDVQNLKVILAKRRFQLHLLVAAI